MTKPKISTPKQRKWCTKPTAEILDLQILGVSELPVFLGVERTTAHVWGYRKQLPEADFDSINGFRAWKRNTVLRWAAETNRLPPWLMGEGARFVPKGGPVRRRRTKAEIVAANA